MSESEESQAQQFQHEHTRRQTEALESIAASLEKLANPTRVVLSGGEEKEAFLRLPKGGGVIVVTNGAVPFDGISNAPQPGDSEDPECEYDPEQERQLLNESVAASSPAPRPGLSPGSEG